MPKIPSSYIILISRFNVLLSISSIAAFALILGLLFAVTINVIVSPSGTVEYYGKIAKTLAFLYGTIFAPGLIISVVFAVYVRKRRLGRNRSYLFEILMIVIAAQTAFTFFIVQDL